MTTEENKTIMRRIAEEIFNKKNPALADELFATDFVQHGGGMEVKGLEDFKQLVNMNITAFPDCRVTIEDLIAEGDKVVCRQTFRGTHRGDFMGIAPTGKPITFNTVVIARFAGGKQVEAWVMRDQLGMMQQLGVIPKK